MKSVTLEWLRAEAAQQGLKLTDADLESIATRLTRLKSALAAIRPAMTETLEPAYHFAAPPPHKGS